MKGRFSRRLFRRGFTLIELLVSLAVLAIVVLAVAQMLSSTSLIVAFGSKHMGADLQARLVFDRIAADLATMVNRQDVDCVFSPATGNDCMFFFGEGPSYVPVTVSGAGSSSVSLIGYRINADYQLERLGKYLNWDGAAGTNPPGSVLFLNPLFSSPPKADPNSTIPGNWPTVLGTAPYTNGSDSSYHVLADGAFRFEICFLVKGAPPSYSQTPPAPDATNIYEVTLGDNAAHSLANISAIVVALAVLDDTSLKLVSNIGNLSRQFPDPVATDLAATPPVLMGQTWGSKLATSGFAASAGVPAAVASQVRIYQRTFYLNN